MAGSKMKHDLTTDTPHSLGDLRRLHGLSQQQVAVNMGIARSGVSRMERTPIRKLKITSIVHYVHAVGGRVGLVARFPDDRIEWWSSGSNDAA
jgi:predicted XRE-type DNA-binding protein